jgi:hypothetical protein
MNALRPPRLATWLLKRLASGDKHESLIGDLAERYQHRRSTVWYWRQALIAILVGAVCDVRDHKALATRAIIISWVVTYGLMFIAGALYDWASPRFATWTFDMGWESARLWWFLYRIPLLMAYCMGSMLLGSIVGRLHRGHRMAMLLIWAVSPLPAAIQFAWAIYDLAQAGLPFFSLTSVPVQVNLFVIFFAMPVCILLGGLWGARPADDQRQIAWRSSI